MSGKKILMLTGEFTEEYEIFVFQKGMEAVGHTVHVVCPDKKAGEQIRTSLHDFEGHQTYLERYGHLAEINKTFAEVEPEEYDAGAFRMTKLVPGTWRTVRRGSSLQTVPAPTMTASCPARISWAKRKESGQLIHFDFSVTVARRPSSVCA